MKEALGQTHAGKDVFRLFFSDLLRFATASDRSSDIVYFLISFFNRLCLFPKVIKIKISALHVSVCVCWWR